MMSPQDLQLVHALQLAPRASWATLGQHLGTDPRALARHYAQLVEQGQVSVMVTLGPRALERVQPGILRVSALPGHTSQVARALAGWSQATTVRLTDGATEIYALVLAPTHRRLADTVSKTVAALPGVAGSELHAVFRTLDAGRVGRLASLPRETQHALQRLRPSADGMGTSARIADGDIELFSLLCRDGRTEVSELARRTRREPSTVSRRLRRLEADGFLDYVSIIPDTASPFPVLVMMWCTITPMDVPILEERIPFLSWIETATVVSGTHNLFLLAHVSSTADVPELHATAHELTPSLQVREVQVVGQPVKLHTRTVDNTGRLEDRVEDPYPVLAPALTGAVT